MTAGGDGVIPSQAPVAGGLRTVEVRERLAAPLPAVWDLICDVESYPKFMPSVRSTTVLDNGEDWTVTMWEVELRGSVMKWIEREERDHARHHLAYHQVEGDLRQFQGYWQLHPVAPAVTDAILLVRFEIGIPMLAEILDPVAEQAIRDNSRRMLRSLGPSLPSP
jgi:ribosome-associated toxin RatA of RatAB toxin-antitoxin module